MLNKWVNRFVRIYFCTHLRASKVLSRPYFSHATFCTYTCVIFWHDSSDPSS